MLLASDLKQLITCFRLPAFLAYISIGCTESCSKSVFFIFQLHEYKAGTPAEKTFFVEMWDIGGWTAHKNSRSVFYNPVHGEQQ